MSATMTAPSANGTKTASAPQATPTAAQLAALGKNHILSLLTSGSIPVDLASEALDLLGKPSGPFSMKVGPKGGITMRGLPGVSVQYGLTLYAKTFQALMDHADEIKAFVEKHRNELSWEKKAV